jgi:hypothetical protein
MINEQSINQWAALALAVEVWGLVAELTQPLCGGALSSISIYTA